MTMDDGITYYVEEIRLGRHELAASTMYKRKKDDSPTLIDWTTQISDLPPFAANIVIVFWTANKIIKLDSNWTPSLPIL